MVHQAPGHQGGEQFLAITDPGTGLEKLAAEHQFWRIFTNPPDIGGRYWPALFMTVHREIARKRIPREAYLKKTVVRET